MALDRPIRYVLEAAYSHYYGDSAGVLGFNHLTSLGVGLELDSTRYPVVITRTRLLVNKRDVGGGTRQLETSVTF